MYIMNRLKWMPKIMKYPYPIHQHQFTKRIIPTFHYRYQHHHHHYYSTMKENNQSIKTKWKYFMKKYGYVSVGVYTVIGFLDLTTTMTLIYFKGADKVKKIETKVMNKIKSITGIQLPTSSSSPSSSSSESTTQPSWSSIFLLALGIHKTILLPIRFFLTLSITPTVAKKLVKYGLIKKITSTK
ncbi:unnamed protein product [Cunninghamella blakesleeana]